MLIALRDVIINRISTSVVKFYLRGTLVYIEVNVKLRVFEHRVFVMATVYSYDSGLKEKSNFPLHDGLCLMHVG